MSFGRKTAAEGERLLKSGKDVNQIANILLRRDKKARNYGQADRQFSGKSHVHSAIIRYKDQVIET